jgi:hypothetical protein
MLTDVLNAPVSELTMGEHIDFCQYLFYSRTLHKR